jgi:hypothetical protein
MTQNGKSKQDNNGAMYTAATIEMLEQKDRETAQSDDVPIGDPTRNLDGVEVAHGSWAKLFETMGNVEWLVPHWIPYAMVTGLIGGPKVGKSAFVQWALVRAITLGEDYWFNETKGLGKPHRVIYIDTEFSGTIIKTRADRWGIPPDMVLMPWDDPTEPWYMDDEKHRAHLELLLCKTGAVLFVIDTLRGAYRGNEDKSEIAHSINALSAIAQKTRAAGLIVHHAKKPEPGAAINLNSGRGSGAFLASVKCQIGIDIPDPKPNLRDACRQVQMLGENVGTAPPAVGFRVTPDGLDIGDAPKKVDKRKDENGKIATAERFIRSRLSTEQHRKATPIIKELLAMGISMPTVDIARGRLGITKDSPYIKQIDGASWWMLPKFAADRTGAQAVTE